MIPDELLDIRNKVTLLSARAKSLRDAVEIIWSLQRNSDEAQAVRPVIVGIEKQACELEEQVRQTTKEERRLERLLLFITQAQQPETEAKVRPRPDKGPAGEGE